MDINLTTPALLFPAVSLLMLAFTNRFLALANLIRTLHDRYQKSPSELTLQQICHLRRRVFLIRNMQAAGVLCILVCVVCMLVLFAGWTTAGKLLFAISLLLLSISLAISLREVWISVHALELQIRDVELSSQHTHGAPCAPGGAHAATDPHPAPGSHTALGHHSAQHVRADEPNPI